MVEKSVSMSAERFQPRLAVRRVWIVTLTGISLGIGIRFWYEVLFPAPPDVMNWSLPINWMLGLLVSAWGSHLSLRHRDRFPPAMRGVLIVINMGIFSGFLLVPGYLLWASL